MSNTRHDIEEKREIAFISPRNIIFLPNKHLDNKVMIALWREKLGIIY